MWLERAGARWMVETLGILRSAQDDGRNAQRQKQRVWWLGDDLHPPIAKVRDRWAPGDLWRPGKNRRRTLPVGEGTVEFAGDGEIGALVGEFGGEGFVDVDAEAGGVAGVHVAGVEGVVVGEDFVGEFRVVHVLLDAEVVDGEAEMERGGHGDGGDVGGAGVSGA